MTKYKVKQDQTIFDIAIQKYGDASQVFKVIADNAQITELLKDITGFELTVDNSRNNLSEYLRTNNIDIVTGSRLVETPGSFDSSFDESFG